MYEIGYYSLWQAKKKKVRGMMEVGRGVIASCSGFEELENHPIGCLNRCMSMNDSASTFSVE